MSLLRSLDRGTRAEWIAAAVLVMVAIGTADAQTNRNITFALFYTIPVAIAAWCGGRAVAWGFALASAVTWIAVDFTKERYDFSRVAYTWNFTSRLALLMAFAAILTALRGALRREQELARRDFVTQVFNTRAFHEVASVEISRARRHRRPLTLIYADVDNFKGVNDSHGHQAGDLLLRTVAAGMRANVRAHDLVGRLGGDEFGILLPDTGGAAARAVVAKIRQQLTEISRAHGWPVSFSIGVVTSIPRSSSSDDLIRQADELMYQVKSSGKDDVRFREDVGALVESRATRRGVRDLETSRSGESVSGHPPTPQR